ncbi:hypothetical protein [Vibrio coralliirubri]|uniref:hypothetical protein n=1 Tax=Vibrio coralliirubri TaxID=1516159 RepID=UPI002FE2B1CE
MRLRLTSIGEKGTFEWKSNFEFLKHHDELLFRLANRAERCFVPDPNTTLVKIGQLGEALAQNVAAP